GAARGGGGRVPGARRADEEERCRQEGEARTVKGGGRDGRVVVRHASRLGFRAGACQSKSAGAPRRSVAAAPTLPRARGERRGDVRRTEEAGVRIADDPDGNLPEEALVAPLRDERPH